MDLAVLLAITVLLLAILIPVTGRTRASASQVKCLSNLKELAQAMQRFADDHRGFLPGRGGASLTKIKADKSVTGGGTPEDVKAPADWIAWMRIIDPVTGAGPYKQAVDQNISYSALAPYLGATPVAHTDAAKTSEVNPELEAMFRCPADPIETRPSTDAGGALTGRGAYRYSYSANIFFMNPLKGVGKLNGVEYQQGQRDGFVFDGRSSSIQNPEQRVLLICEDERTLDDGTFMPTPASWRNNTKVNMIASRHDRGLSDATTQNVDTRGNAAFCDGHAEFIGRKDALRQRHTGRPDPDQVDF